MCVDSAACCCGCNRHCPKCQAGIPSGWTGKWHLQISSERGVSAGRKIFDFSPWQNRMPGQLSRFIILICRSVSSWYWFVGGCAAWEFIFTDQKERMDTSRTYKNCRGKREKLWMDWMKILKIIWTVGASNLVRLYSQLEGKTVISNYSSSTPRWLLDYILISTPKIQTMSGQYNNAAFD